MNKVSSAGVSVAVAAVAFLTLVVGAAASVTMVSNKTDFSWNNMLAQYGEAQMVYGKVYTEGLYGE